MWGSHKINKQNKGVTNGKTKDKQRTSNRGI